ncbi:GmrSD restriction endonuclease domain-containing protein [Escherichia coli]|uniref:GmrSD restriction endonuclease domain-containing protein n=1 Tax=Escherichia coli TaxID=562 RepID=UPI0040689E0E
MLPSETMIWQPEFTDKTLSRKIGAVQLYPGRLDAPKMRSMLTELERELCRQVKTEKPDVPNLSNLDIDHLMPQSWYSCWPLENGRMVTNSDATVLNQIVLSGTDLTPEQLLVRKRQQAISTLGNLTLLVSVQQEPY